jgi:hypothetical protein
VDLFAPFVFVFVQPVLMLAILRVERDVTQRKDPNRLYNHLLALHGRIHGLQNVVGLVDNGIGINFFEGGGAYSGVDNGPTGLHLDHFSFGGG